MCTSPLKQTMCDKFFEEFIPHSWTTFRDASYPSMTSSSSECTCLCVRLLRSVLVVIFQSEVSFCSCIEMVSHTLPFFPLPSYCFSPPCTGFLLILAHFNLHPLAHFHDGSHCPPLNHLIVQHTFLWHVCHIHHVKKAEISLAVVVFLLCPSLSVSSMLSRDKMSGSDFSA